MYLIFQKKTGKTYAFNSWQGILGLVFIAFVLWSMYSDEFAKEAKLYLKSQTEIIKKYGSDPSISLSESRNVHSSTTHDGKYNEGYRYYIFTVVGNGKYSTESVYVYGNTSNPKEAEYSQNSQN